MQSMNNYQEVTRFAHQLITPEGALLVCFLSNALPERFYQITGLVKKHRVNHMTRIKETLLDLYRAVALPICKNCGLSTDLNMVGEHCSCIDLGEVTWQPLGEFDIEL